MKKSLSRWFSYIEGLHSQTIALGLDRIRIVAEKLGVLFFSCPVISIAGTNGKGSCVAFLEAILTAAGYKVGTYTSPHLLLFNERIRIDCQEVDDTSLMQAFTQVEQARGDIALTYFEFTTLAALVLFQTVCLDVLVLEVGLGGRLDAVNLVDPDIAIITSIALDHMDLLGHTREAIGYEKAGIFRFGKPAICGDPDPPLSVQETACTLGAQWYCADRDFSSIRSASSEADQTWTWQSRARTYSNLPIPRLPLQNATTALMAIECLQQHLQVSESAIVRGLEMAFLSGRQQHFYTSTEIILDVAHNPAATTYLAKSLSEQPISGLTRAVVSILSDKDAVETLRPLLPVIQKWYVAGLQIARGATAENMANDLHKLGAAAYDMHLSETVMEAFQQALSESDKHDRIVVFGSFHTVAAVLETLHATA